jgi:CubicO group peptidase (beta-lactamase class C family)
MTATAFGVRSADQDRVAEPQVDPKTGKRPPMPDLTTKPRWLSGGAGLVSTAADYLSFTNMLLNGGTGPVTRLLSSATVRLMTADSLPPGLGYSERAHTVMADLAPTPAAGQGFGLGFAVRTAAGRNPLPGSVGTYYWTAAFGPTFWVDPTEKLIGIMMIQVPYADTGPYRRTIRYLAYQALLDHTE